jgi:hypothetical protein
MEVITIILGAIVSFLLLAPNNKKYLKTLKPITLKKIK